MKKRTRLSDTSLPEPPEPQHHYLQQKDWIIILVTLMTLVFVAKAGYDHISGNLIYQDYGYGYGYGSGFGGFGFFNFSDLYMSYGYIIDAALFLLIFLGIGKGVFKQHFREGGTAVYVGVGIFLAFALLLWEERSGFYLLQEFGPLVMGIFFLVIGLWVFRWLMSSGLPMLPMLCIVYLFLYAFFYFAQGTALQITLLDKFYDPDYWQTAGAVAAIATIALLGWLIFHKRVPPQPQPNTTR